MFNQAHVKARNGTPLRSFSGTPLGKANVNKPSPGVHSPRTPHERSLNQANAFDNNKKGFWGVSCHAEDQMSSGSHSAFSGRDG